MLGSPAFHPESSRRAEMSGDCAQTGGRQQHRDKDNPTPHFPTPFTFVGYRPAMDDLARKANPADRPALRGGLPAASLLSSRNVLILATIEGTGC